MTFSPPETLPITSPHGPCVTKDGKLFFAGRAFSDDEKASFAYLDEGIYALTLDEDAKPLNKPVKIAPAYSGDENNAFFCEPHALTSVSYTHLSSLSKKHSALEPVE